MTATDGLVRKFDRRWVKKKNGLSSVEATMLSGNAAKKAASALPDSKVEVRLYRQCRVRMTLKPRLDPCPRGLPLGIRESVGTGHRSRSDRR